MLINDDIIGLKIVCLFMKNNKWKGKSKKRSGQMKKDRESITI